MREFEPRTLLVSKWITLAVGIGVLAALLTGGAVVVGSVRPQPPSPWTDNGVKSRALKWFAEMQSGEIDRTPLTPDYSAQLTDAAVQGMSRYLREHKYGVSPTGAEVLQARRSGEQTLYVIKLLFPRGDAASLLLGFNAQNQITGVSLLSTAGD